MQTPQTLDDLQLGQTFRTTSHTLTLEALLRFAEEFDPQPFHTDEVAARDTIFRGLAASGWQVAALTMKLIVTSGLPLQGGIVGAGADVTWPAPTRAGDTLHVESEVIEITPSASRPDRGRVVIRNTTVNQRGEVVQVMLARLVVPRLVRA